MKLLRPLHRALKSVKLAIVLLLLLAAVAALATLAPRGPDVRPFWAWLVNATGLGRFPRSALFLAPAAVLFVNTAVCAADRFARRCRAAASPRFGPDLVHLGVLVLIGGAMLTAAARREGLVRMAEGDQAMLAGEYVMTLRSYRFDRYPDGRPRDWVSTVDVSRGEMPAVTGFAIEVNRPLRVGRLQVLQAGFAREARATLVDAAGRQQLIRTGEALRLGQRLLVLAGVEASGLAAVFEEWEGPARRGMVRAAAGEKVGDHLVREIREVDVTALEVVDDPGFVPVLAALALIAAGLSLTAAQKTRDRQS